MKSYIVFFKVFIVLAALIGCAIITSVHLSIEYMKNNYTPTIVLNEDTITFWNKTPEEGLFEALEYYDIQYPEIVYSQAILETHYFQSDICIKNNNLFGLYDSKHHKYYSFDHWSESVLAYRKWIQSKYKGEEYYLKFLQDMGYAEDKQYVNKVKKILNDTRTNK